MADWVDSYFDTRLPQSELDRLFKEHQEGRISRNYMLGLFGMSESDFEDAKLDSSCRRLAEMTGG